MKLLLRSPAHRGMNDRTAMVALARQISAAVSFLHARGVIHRDLKPQNVLIAGTGQDVICKLCDFGISSIGEHQRSVHTMRTLTIGQGTTIYMAPEGKQAGACGSRCLHCPFRSVGGTAWQGEVRREG